MEEQRSGAPGHLPTERVARAVALVAGLVVAVGAVWKVFIWGKHVEAMQAYTVLAWIPDAALAAGSLVVEVSVAALLLLPGTWRRLGLPAATGFLLLTALILAVETLAGGSGDCGCLPFLTREIGWLAVFQNLAAALFFGGLWGLLGTEDDRAGQ